MSKWKYKRGDVFVEREAISGKPISYRVILRRLNHDRYITCSIELSYDDDWISAEGLDKWFEKCDHTETKFANSLSPNVCEEYMGIDAEKDVSDREHEAMLHRDDLNEISLCLEMSKLGCDETVAETGDPEVKARAEHIDKIIRKINIAERKYD